ncbi:hypothetical protein H6G04_27690 [Calothrix membranacea FACHB-236]|nr:hypothetical protein [Calothrix membranacea FACHB-236]
MPSQDKFVQALRDLKKDFPEYANILESLIGLIQKGKVTKLREKLDKLKQDEW